MENLAICPLRVTDVVYKKTGGIITRNYDVRATVKCTGLCNEAGGAEGSLNIPEVVVPLGWSMAEARRSAHPLIFKFTQQHLKCPYVEPEVFPDVTHIVHPRRAI